MKVNKICYWLIGEILVGTALAFTHFLSPYYFFRFFRLLLSVSYYSAMYFNLVSYNKKYINAFLYIYFFISIYFISQKGFVSAFQWGGYKITTFILNYLN